MSCKEPLDFEFISENTTKDFVGKKWRAARKEVLIGVEISKLPASQESARRYNEHLKLVDDAKIQVEHIINTIKTDLEIPEDKTLKEYIEIVKGKIKKYRGKRDDREFSREERKTYKEKASKYTKKRTALNKAIHLVNSQKREISYAQSRLKNFERILSEFDDDTQDNVDEKQPERRAFVMPCPFDECKGFLSTGYKCGLCNKKICPSCHVKLDPKSSEGEDHVCQKEALETVKMINSETKPCPKCGARISKINGCDQMWCICCKTAFSWNTGRVVVGERIHNPEYFRWMRDREIAIPRAEDQIGCDARPSLEMFYAIRRQFTAYNFNYVINLIQKMEHFSAMIRNNQISNRDLRVAYLTNTITKEKMQETIIKRERIGMKIRFINGIHQLIVDVLADILRKIRDTPANFETLQSEAYNLCNYANEQFSKFQKKHNLSTPQYENSPNNMFNLVRE